MEERGDFVNDDEPDQHLHGTHRNVVSLFLPGRNMIDGVPEQAKLRECYHKRREQA